MESVKCQKHGRRKDFLFCLDSRCEDRLGCQKCYQEDKRHKKHKYILIKELMNDDVDELERVFNSKGVLEKLKTQKDRKQLVDAFDSRIEQYLDQREEQIRIPFEKMMSRSRLLIENWKNQYWRSIEMQDMESMDGIKSSLIGLLDSGDHELQKKIKDDVDDCMKMIDNQKQFDKVMEWFKQIDQQMINGLQQIVDQQSEWQSMILQYHGIKMDENNHETVDRLTTQRVQRTISDITVLRANTIQVSHDQQQRQQQQQVQ